MSTLLQLSDLHLLADSEALYRGIRPGNALAVALGPGAASASGVSLLLLTGDLVQDESWQGYARLRDLLEPLDTAVALLPGNHDRPTFLRACLGRRGTIAPALVPFAGWWLLPF